MNIIDYFSDLSTLHVGPGQPFTTVTEAFRAARDGDTLLVRAGTYAANFADATTSITFRAVGGTVTLEAA